MHKIAILSDIHGNTIALDRVLEDIQAQGGADEFWILGDVAALGFDPAGVVARLAALPQARFLRGNTDRYIASGVFPGRPLEEIRHDLPRLEKKLELAAGIGWTTGALAAAGWLPWLEALPLDFRVTLPDGTRLLAVHASPGTDDGHGILARMSDAEVRPLLAGADADLVFVGHTHIPFDRRIDGVRVVNPGSISNPFPPDLRASYAVLTHNSTGHTLEHRRVDYDREAAVAATQRLKQPSAGYIVRHLRGEVQPD